MTDNILATRETVKESFIEADRTLSSISAQDVKTIGEKIVTMQSTAFFPITSSTKPVKLFTDKIAVDEVYNTHSFPDATSAYKIYAISVEPNIHFGSDEVESMETLHRFLSQSFLEIKRKDKVIQTIPLMDAVKFDFEKQVQYDGTNTTKVLTQKVIRTAYNLGDFSIVVSKNEKIEIQLKLDQSFTTSTTLYTTYSNLPSSVSLASNQGNSIQVKLYAVELSKNI